MLSAVLLVFGMVGCTKNNNPVPSTASPTSSTSTARTGAQVDIGNTINYASFGTTTSLDCGDGKSLTVAGSNNTLTVKGTCASVNVLGADNKITLDKVDKDLRVAGMNNTITYKDGEPKVKDVGSSNTVNKAS